MISSFSIDGILRRPKLPCMPLPRLHHRVTIRILLAASGLALLAACERKTPPSRVDSLAVPGATPVDSGQPAGESSGWSASAGPALLVQGDTRDEAIVLLPSSDSAAFLQLDSASVHGAATELFGRGGARFSAHLGAAPREGDAECRVWPLQNVRTDGNAATWGVGFVGGRVSPLPLDSVEVLSARDSMMVAAEASRLASAVTASTDPAFQGLRFTAHDVRRFEVAPGVQGLVAHVIRKVNQEANPREEQTLLIAERDSGVTSGPYRLAYAERTQGLEEEVTTPEVIAAVRIGPAAKPTLIVARDNESGVSYAMLERVDARRWRVRWTSGTTRCGV
jgi:hypothetical protein